VNRLGKQELRISVVFLLAILLTVNAFGANRVRTQAGIVEGTRSADSKVYIFKGIPYAAPPVGVLRWKAPKPAPPWQKARQATKFGPRCMQIHLYDDMFFRDDGPSEDCLYLNVWTTKLSPRAKLPVMLWLHGGGDAGSSSEPRQDGENLARKGVVVVSLNYRLGVFGFFAHPDLAIESDHHATGNYGLLDQIAALRWVRENCRLWGRSC
jgi:para-nitrobenzyl esterase